MKLTKLEINRNLLIVSNFQRCYSNGNFAQNVWCTLYNAHKCVQNESRHICSVIYFSIFNQKFAISRRFSSHWCKSRLKMQLESIFSSICFDYKSDFGAKRSSRLMLTSLFAMQSVVVVVWCQRGIMINIEHFGSNAALLLSNNYALDLSVDIIDCCRSNLHWNRLIYFWTLFQTRSLPIEKCVCFNFTFIENAVEKLNSNNFPSRSTKWIQLQFE